MPEVRGPAFTIAGWSVPDTAATARAVADAAFPVSAPTGISEHGIWVISDLSSHFSLKRTWCLNAGRSVGPSAVG